MSVRRVIASACVAGVVLVLTGCLQSPASPVRDAVSAPAEASPSPIVAGADAPAPSPSAAPAADPALEAQLEAMDAYIDAAQAAVPMMQASGNGAYEHVAIVADDASTLVYEYFFAAPVDATMAVENFDAQRDTFQAVCDSAVFPEMIANGITIDPKVRYVYFNPDGTILWDATFSPSAS